MITSRTLPLSVLLLLAACASSPGDKSPGDAEQREIVDVPSVDADTSLPEQRPDEVAETADSEPLLDRTQRTVYGMALGTAQVVDNMFGSAGVEEEASVTRGRLSVGAQWDQRDDLRERIRIKARFGLPAMKNRTSLLLGRGDVNDLIDGSADDNIDTLPDRFNDYQDEDWLVGVGYSHDTRLRRGWSFGAGVRLATPLEPFVRATYRWHRGFGDSWLWRVEPRVFVQNQRGAGASVQNSLDYVISERWLLRSWSIGVAEEEVEGISWTSKLVAYQNLSRKAAVSYAVYGTGETEYEVPTRDYGIEVRYRRQVSREWFFIELLTYMNWPRDFLIENRERNIGIGIEFEMQFGDWPGRKQNRPSAGSPVDDDRIHDNVQATPAGPDAPRSFR